MCILGGWETCFENGWNMTQCLLFLKVAEGLLGGTVLHVRHWFPWALHLGGQSIYYRLVLLFSTLLSGASTNL